MVIAGRAQLELGSFQLPRSGWPLLLNRRTPSQFRQSPNCLVSKTRRLRHCSEIGVNFPETGARLPQAQKRSPAAGDSRASRNLGTYAGSEQLVQGGRLGG